MEDTKRRMGLIRRAGERRERMRWERGLGGGVMERGENHGRHREMDQQIGRGGENVDAEG